MLDRPVQVAGTGHTKTSPQQGMVQGCVCVWKLIKTMAVCLAQTGSRGRGGAHLNRCKEEGVSPREFEKAA